MTLSWETGAFRYKDTYLVDTSSKVEQNGFSKFASVNAVVLAKVFVRDTRRVDVDEHLLVVRALLDDGTTERDKVVQRREHFWRLK